MSARGRRACAVGKAAFRDVNVRVHRAGRPFLATTDAVLHASRAKNLDVAAAGLVYGRVHDRVCVYSLNSPACQLQLLHNSTILNSI